MKNLVSIVEIPVLDLSRAVSFYESVLDISIEKADMGGTQMGVFPSARETVNIVLVKGDDYIPWANGAVLYWYCGEDLQPALDRVVEQGGQELLPKTMISPDMGYYALFLDSEGNKFGLHSAR